MVKLTIIGSLGKDAIATNYKGKNVINFSVCHNEKTADGEQKCIWAECAYWTESQGILPYLKKGTQVYLEGNPTIKTYTNKDGIQVSNFAVRVNFVKLLSSQVQQVQQVATQQIPQQSKVFQGGQGGNYQGYQQQPQQGNFFKGQQGSLPKGNNGYNNEIPQPHGNSFSPIQPNNIETYQGF